MLSEDTAVSEFRGLMTDLLQPRIRGGEGAAFLPFRQALTEEGHQLVRRLILSTDAEIDRLQARVAELGAAEAHFEQAVRELIERWSAPRAAAAGVRRFL